MKHPAHTGLQIMLQIIIFEILGVIFIGPHILWYGFTTFSFTLFGISAILYCHVFCLGNARSDKVLLSALIPIIVIIIASTLSREVIISLRNLMWFALIGLLSYSIFRFQKRDLLNSYKLLPVALWLVGFIILYVVMLLMNIYVFRVSSYKLDGHYTFTTYFIQSLKMGSILGLGIGVGKVINDFLFLNSETRNQVKHT